MSKKQKPQPKISDFNAVLISTNKKYTADNGEPINMYAITFMLGSRKVSQTRHMTASQLKAYAQNPSVDLTTNAQKGKGLQNCHFNRNNNNNNNKGGKR